MRFSRVTGLTFALAASALAISAARADFIAMNQPSGTVGRQSGGPYSLGQDFTVNSPITITNLLAFDSGANGLAANVTVSIYSDTTQQIVPGLTATFNNTNSTLLAGSGFRALNSFAPVTLTAGNYRVAGSNYGATTEPNTNTNEPGNHGAAGNDPAPTYNTGGGLVTYNGNFYSTSINAYPTTSDNGQYGAGSFQFTAAPEPSSLACLGLGGAALLARRRRQA